MEIKVLVLCAALLGSTSAKCLGNNCDDGHRSPEGSSQTSGISITRPGNLIRKDSDSEGQHNSKFILGTSNTRYGETNPSGYGIGSPVGVGSSSGSFGNSRPFGYDYRVGGGTNRNDGYQGNRGNTFTDGFINSINTDSYSNDRPSGIGGGLFSGDYPGGRYPGNGGYADDGRGRYPSNSFGFSDTGYNNVFPSNNNYGGYPYGDGGYNGYEPNFLPGGGNTFTFLPGSGYVRNVGDAGGSLPGNVYFPRRNNDGFLPSGGIYTVPLGDTGRYPIYSNFNNNRGFGSTNPSFVGDSFAGNNLGGFASRYPNLYPANDNRRFFSGNNFGYPGNNFGGGSRYPSGGNGFVDGNSLPVGTNTGFVSPAINTGYGPPTVTPGYGPPTVTPGYLPPPGK
ncbi:prisilkin-39-like [Macrobrachium nipponense]|uniref:prisilkin-39-like n=1 Tax=Macrobrachium nipponense TaxID=159736 RepID=UPI0030C847C6